ncbi:PHB depolymerase family esterase [Arenibaculum sp.]|uniref:extracellular catalytic domain type 1 short-chain-length polyhydroxyalkanoate depolymerase n=1 Tax=Arenibaculum sp. TaxID=2865862 RepID=UPI002E125D40|nr:PHB depolymerase family esterase [Arenibaculum sp.]
MTDRFRSGMAEATRLTGAGKLSEATALIQRLLGGGAAPAPAGAETADPRLGDPTVIDADYVTLDEAPPERPAPRPDGPARPRSGLGETLRGLRRRAKAPQPAPVPLPDGAAFETASHSGAAGTRAYRLYVPASRTGGPLPLVVMLHGCTQSPDDFAAGTGMNALAEEHGCLVAYPEQPSSANANKCWNWFEPGHQERDRGEPSLIAGIVRQIMRDHPVDAARVYVAGLSAGGAAAALVAAAYPDLFAAVGVHSGLPAGAARDLPSAFAAMRQGAAGDPARRGVPTIVFHGDRDTTVHPRNGDAVAALATASAAGRHPAVERGRVPGGHAYSRAVHADPSGRVLCEQWTVHGAGHAWAGGSPSGSYTDPRGPDAAREMLRFFLAHRLPGNGP